MTPRAAILAALAMATALAAGPAAALSCMRADPVMAYQRAAASGARYSVVHGRLAFDPAQLPKSEQIAPGPRSFTIPARIEGHGLGAQGFTTPFAEDITIRLDCTGPWCGSARQGRSVLAFLRHGPAGKLLEIGPCPEFLFPHVTADQVAQVVQCHRSPDCRSGANLSRPGPHD